MAAAAAFIADLGRRIRRKLVAVIPIILGAVVLTGVLLVFVYLILPLLPESVQELLQALQSGDWEASRERLTALVDGFGDAKPYAFMGVQVLQVLFAPIPGQVVGLLGGYFFGFWHGLFLTMAGLAVGTWIAVGLGRILGSRLVRRFVPQTVMAKFDYLVTEGGLWNFFMLFLLPALPDDAICFIAGLTRLRVWKLVAVALLGRLPGMAILLLFGASVEGDLAAANVVLVVATVLAAVLWLYSDEAEAYFARLTRRIASAPDAE